MTPNIENKTPSYCAKFMGTQLSTGKLGVKQQWRCNLDIVNNWLVVSLPDEKTCLYMSVIWSQLMMYTQGAYIIRS